MCVCAFVMHATTHIQLHLAHEGEDHALAGLDLGPRTPRVVVDWRVGVHLASVLQVALTYEVCRQQLLDVTKLLVTYPDTTIMYGDILHNVLI